MFTWICPQCGREVPPSYSECPDCAERAAKAANPAPADAATASPAGTPQATPSQAARPVDPAPTPAAPAQPAVQYVYVKRGQPGWLVALLVAVALVGAGAAAYYFLLPSVRAQRAESAAQQETVLETPKQAAGSEAPQSARMAKFLEVTGLRIVEENKRPQLRYIIVNHSAADLAGIKGAVVLRASNAAPGTAPIATVPLDVASLGPYEVREMITSLKTNLRAYELPDWQFLKADLQITGQ